MLFATEQSIAEPNAVTAQTTPFPRLKPLYHIIVRIMIFTSFISFT